MSFESNFQPPGTSDDQSFELIGALLWCSVTTSTGRHLGWIQGAGLGDLNPQNATLKNTSFFTRQSVQMFSMQP